MGARAHQASAQKLAQCSASVCWLTTENYPPVPSHVLTDLISTDRLGTALSLLACNAVILTRCSARVGEGMWSANVCAGKGAGAVGY